MKEIERKDTILSKKTEIYAADKKIIIEKRGTRMKKGKKILRRVVESVAIRIAKSDANAACPCISYQPKLPESVQKLRKF